MNKFVNLHVHSWYSLSDGLSSPEVLVETAIAKQQDTLAITEHGSLRSAYYFWKACTDKNIKPILGIEAYFCDTIKIQNKDERNRHIVLLAKNAQGWQELKNLNTIANREGFYRKPRVDIELLKQFSNNLICLTACISGPISYEVSGGYEDAEAESAGRGKKHGAYIYKELRRIFGDRLFLELQLLDVLPQHRANKFLLYIAEKSSTKCVLTCDVHYAQHGQVSAHNMLVHQAWGKTFTGELAYGTDRLWLQNSDDIFTYHAKTPAFNYLSLPQLTCAIAESTEIADSIETYEPFKTKNTFPAFPRKLKTSNIKLLATLALKGLKTRKLLHKPEYKQRILTELKAIRISGFTDYFLIIWDLVKYARSIGALVGPGRGSATGSLVFYALQVTQRDPIADQLPFERFLKPGERVSPPDADLDFSSRHCEQIIQYIKDTYGADKVMNISTVNTMAVRGALKAVQRVLDIPFDRVNFVTNQIPFKMEDDYDISTIPEVQQLYDDYPEIEEYIDNFQGVPLYSGVHPAGILITPTKVEDWVPVGYQSKSDTLFSEWDMHVIEDINLLKIDVLRLNTLNIIQDIIKLTGKDIDIYKLPESKTVYDIFHKGLTKGIFQFGSPMATHLAREIKPTNIRELSDVTALDRPSILDLKLHELYIARRNGSEPTESIHPIVDKILKPTYNIAPYQEQVMQICIDFADFTYKEADALRKAMKHKSGEEFEKYRQKFIQSATAKSNNNIAERTWEMVEKFSGYGFSICHSVPYAYLGYICGWLKVNYPKEFYCAVFTNEDNQETFVGVLREAQDLGIKVTYPDINISESNFKIQGHTIRFGFLAIKGLGEKAVAKIIDNRPKNGFTSLNQFIELANPTARDFAALLKAKALDNLTFQETTTPLTPRQKLSKFKEIKKSKAKTDITNPIQDEEEALGCILDPAPLLSKCKKFYAEYDITEPSTMTIKKFEKFAFGGVVVDKTYASNYCTLHIMSRKSKVRMNIDKTKEAHKLKVGDAVAGILMWLEDSKVTINSKDCYLKLIEELGE